MIPLFRFRPDIPFSRDDTNRFLPFIVAFIVFITAMMIASGMGLYDVVRTSSRAREGSFSVHIPADSANADQLANSLLTALKNNADVSKAELIDASQMREWVKPWLGDGASADLIPLPRIIEVSVSQDIYDQEGLKRKILALAPGAEIDDHSKWVSQYTALITALQWSLWIAALLFMATTLAIVILTTRASIRIHQRVIQILHTIGARDCYIARQFQYNAFLIAARGGFFGSLAALGVYLGLCLMTSHFAVPLMPSFRLGAWQAGLFALLPLLIGVGALVSSRLTVLAELRRMP